MTVRNFEKPLTVVVPAIALRQSGVEGMFFSLSFFLSYRHTFRLLYFFFFVFSFCPSVLVESGVATMPTIPCIFNFHSFLHVTTLIVLLLLSFSVSVCN